MSMGAMGAATPAAGRPARSQDVAELVAFLAFRSQPAT
jgi:hypothetical protein